MASVTSSVITYFRRGFVRLFSVIKDLWVILNWWETWVPTLIALGVVCFWSFFAFALALPNPWRSILIWGVILGLVTIAPGYAFFSGRKK